MNNQANSTENNIFTKVETDYKENDLLEVLLKRGLIPDLTINDDKIQKVKQTKAKREYKNTFELLKNYRRIVYAISTIPQNIAYELDSPLATVNELVEKCDIACSMDDYSLETQLKGVKRSTALLNIVNRALTAVKNLPKDGPLLYNILYYTYLSPDPCTVKEITEKLNISDRTYYRRKTEAIKLLSSILWLAPNPELDAWLDIVTILSEE